MFVLYDKTLFNGKERGYFNKHLWPNWSDDLDGAYGYEEDELEDAESDRDMYNRVEGYSLEIIEIV